MVGYWYVYIDIDNKYHALDLDFTKSLFYQLNMPSM